MILLGVVYIGFLLFFGKPYPNRAITGDVSYAEAAHENDFVKKLYFVRKPFLNGGLILCVLGCILMFPQDSLVEHANDMNKVKWAKKLTGLSLWIYVIVVMAGFIQAILNFIIMKDTQNEILREFSRADFLLALGVMFLGIYCVSEEIRCNRYLALELKEISVSK